MDINTAGERSYIYAESLRLAEYGGYFRNLADKNQGEDDNYCLNNAVAYFRAEKVLGLSIPVPVSISLFSSSKSMAFPRLEKRL